MANYKNIFTTYLDLRGIKYVDKDDRCVVVSYLVGNMLNPVHIAFGNDGQPDVQFEIKGIHRISRRNEKAFADGVLACQIANSKYRWASFFVDDDFMVRARTSTYVTAESCGAICDMVAQRMAAVVADAGSIFIEAFWDTEDEKTNLGFHCVLCGRRTDGKDVLFCSECNERVKRGQEAVCMDCCPNCGAKISGKEDAFCMACGYKLFGATEELPVLLP